MTLAYVRSLATAMVVPGALQSLEELCFVCYGAWQSGQISLLAGAMASGAAPLLRTLQVECVFGYFKDEDVEALAAMLEARAQLSTCRGLEQLHTFGVLDEARSLAMRCRLLRAFLPSATGLDRLEWDAAYEDCFVTVQPSRVTKMVEEETNTPISEVEVWESLPALEELTYEGACSILPAYPSNLDSFLRALNRGVAFQRLQKLSLSDFDYDAVVWKRALQTLAGAACASQLTSLEFSNSYESPAFVAPVSQLLSQGAYPALNNLAITHSKGVGDTGVVALAQALLDAPTIRLAELSLSNVEIGDEGMAALARVLEAGRFDRLETICLGDSDDVTDAGLGAWVRAIDTAGVHGLPILCLFHPLS